MFKIIFTVLFTLNIIHATNYYPQYGCLTVSSTPTHQCAHIPEFATANIDFGKLHPGSSDNVYQMPVYIKSNSFGAIGMKIQPIKIRNHKQRSSIKYLDTTFTSTLTGRVTTFRRETIVQILPMGFMQFRNGHTLVGYVSFKLPDISELESEGSFSATAKVRVYNWMRSGRGKIKINYSVEPVLVVGLFDVSHYSGDKLFKHARVDFGMLDNNDETVKEVDVYVKTNYENMSVYMTFDDIPPLYHTRAEEKIDVQYSYKQKNRSSYQGINQGSEILLFSHFKNDGTKPVGTLKFTAEPAEGKLSGNYHGKIRVTISAQ